MAAFHSAFDPTSGPSDWPFSTATLGRALPIETPATRGKSGSTKVVAKTRIAAIDVGSNAIRLVIGETDSRGEIRLLKKFREGVRLGKDTFSNGEISKRTLAQMLESFVHFKQLLREHRVSHVRAVATSALREASNKLAIVGAIADATGIKIEVIDGGEEGRLIFSAVSNRVDLTGTRSVLIDIGGGSVELTVAEGTKLRGSRSFQLGTVRLLERLSESGLKEKHLGELIAASMRPVRSFLRDTLRGKRVHFALGTGGNFECLGKLRVALLSKTSIHSITHEELSELTEHLSGLTVKERIRYLRLRDDRADVIVPAALVTLAVLAAIPTETLHIPFVGLREGLLRSLADSIE